MTMTTHVYGDQIEILYQPHNHTWMAPATGRTCAEWQDAMRAELHAYMLSAGEDVDNDEIQDEIETYVRESVASA